MALAFSRRVAVLSALVAVLCVAALLARPAAGIRVATYFLDASVDPRNLAFSSVVNLPNDANSMLNTFIASNAATRMKQIAGLIDEDVFAFQNGVTVLRQTPATVFPATQVYADTVATLLSELHALGRDYTILGESLDFDISSPQVDPAVPDVTNKLRFKIRSGLAVRTALLPLLQWKSSGVFVSQQAITPVSPTLSPVYVGLGWQRAKIFLDGVSWVITQAYFSDSSTPNAAQAGELINIINTSKDEYAIFLGVTNDLFGAFAVSTMSVGGFVSASAIVNQPFPTCCLVNPFVAPQPTTLPALFSTLDDIMLRTPRIQVSNFEVFTDNLSVYPLSQRIYPSSHLFVAARVLPLRQDGLPAAAVPLPLPAAPPPPKPVQRMDSSGSFEVVDIEYSQLSSVVQPPTVPGAYTPAPDQAYMRPDLPVATTTSAQAYEANAFIQQVRPLTHSASNDAVAVAASVFVTAILAVVACAMHM